MVKLQVPAGGSSKEFVLLIVPTPVTSRKLDVWLETIDEVRSKVKPPTLHKLLSAGPADRAGGVDKLKIHGAPMVALVEKPGVMLLKSPVTPDPHESFQTFTCVARSSDVVSAPAWSPNVTTPLKLMFPWIGLAWSCGQQIAPAKP